MDEPSITILTLADKPTTFSPAPTKEEREAAMTQKYGVVNTD